MAKNSPIVILTGAGISAESGIRTFRATDGLWEEHRIEEVATPAGFARNPDLVHRFYNQRRRQLLDGIKANAAHAALARLDRCYPGELLLVTQNIDNLHEQAGSRRLVHMHGELLNLRCQVTGRVINWRGDSSTASVCPCCQQPGNLRPAVVWFGEMPMHLEQIYAALEQCQLFVAIGTSGNVYPAAGFLDVANARGAHTVELNLERSVSGSRFRETMLGPATRVVPAFVDRLLGETPTGDSAFT